MTRKNENKPFAIAIDGPSGAGKSTIAKALAEKLYADYIDTGAMYRAVALKAVRVGVDGSDEAELQKMLDATDIDFRGGSIFLDGEDVSGFIRTPEISSEASRLSAFPQVRTKLVALQRAMGERKNVVMDGRDIGTNVFKDARCKLFITARAEERARRRTKELLEKGMPANYEEVLADAKKRDKDDSTRSLNPLVKADDAIEINTDGMGIEEVLAFALAEAEKKGCFGEE